MHSVRVSSQLLVSGLFIAVPTNAEILIFSYTFINLVLQPILLVALDNLQLIS